MSITGRDSKEQVVSSGARYTGLANMIVASINPSWEELKVRNSNAKEPNYVTQEFAEEKKGREAHNYSKNRLAFSLYHPERKFYAPLTIWLEDRVRYNLSGDKVEWINKYGQTTWSSNETDPPGYDWFKKEGARPAYGGESTLTDFIRNWANCGENDQAVLDNPVKLANGDYTELRAVFNAIKKNEVQVLVGVKKDVRDGKTNYYQDVYTGKFDRPYRRDFAGWIKQLEDPYGAFKSDWQNDLHLKVYENFSRTVETPDNLDTATAGATPGSNLPPDISF
jgi:hypothetical protein